MFAENGEFIERPQKEKKPPAYKRMIGRLTIHGITDFCESHNTGFKIIWLGIILIAFTLLIVEIYYTIIT